MELDVEVFALPKLGAIAAEYEDASSPTGQRRVVGASFTCAIADGATEASFSGLWARLLVEGYVEAAPSPGLLDLAARASETWVAKVGQRPLPWYAEQKAASGAFAAFLGLQLTSSPTPVFELATYAAEAVGDCCLVHVRDNRVLVSFPLTSSDEFNSSPSLLATRHELNAMDLVRRANGTCNSDDMLLLMSDALSRWFLAEVEAGGEPWLQVRDLNTDDGDSFEEFVARLRTSGGLKNDDTTLMRITVY